MSISLTRNSDFYLLTKHIIKDAAQWPNNLSADQTKENQIIFTPRRHEVEAELAHFGYFKRWLSYIAEIVQQVVNFHLWKRPRWS